VAAPEPRRAHGLALLIVAGAFALVAARASHGEGTRRAAVRELSDRALVELAWLAGLQEEVEGALPSPMAVGVVQDGGEPWVRDVVVEAVEASDAFRLGDSRHVLRVEAVDTPDVIALQLGLWRQGWDLRAPDVGAVRVAPWAPVLAAALGAAVAWSLARPAVGLLVAGLLAQALVAGLPWPVEDIRPVPWSSEILHGPLGIALAAAARGLAQAGAAVAAAVVAFCLALVWFDHRASRGRTGSMSLPAAALAALCVGVGGVAWLDAATRAAGSAALHTWTGALAAVALAAAWVPALRRGRSRRSPRAA
jgi:hypothetical protein